MTATMEKRPPTITDKCGTLAGYTRHRRAGEDWCDRCREAKKLYNRENQRRKRKRDGFEKQWHTTDRVLDLLQISAGWWDLTNLCDRLGANEKAVSRALHRLKHAGAVENRKVWNSAYDQSWLWRATKVSWEVDYAELS